MNLKRQRKRETGNVTNLKRKGYRTSGHLYSNGLTVSFHEINTREKKQRTREKKESKKERAKVSLAYTPIVLSPFVYRCRPRK